MSREHWYNSAGSCGQGLVIEDTGRTVAVCYDEKDAPLIASAPELVEALESLVAVFAHTEGNDRGNKAKTEILAHNPDVRTALNRAYAVLNEAKGE